MLALWFGSDSVHAAPWTCPQVVHAWRHSRMHAWLHACLNGCMLACMADLPPHPSPRRRMRHGSGKRSSRLLLRAPPPSRTTYLLHVCVLTGSMRAMHMPDTSPFAWSGLRGWARSSSTPCTTHRAGGGGTTHCKLPVCCPHGPCSTGGHACMHAASPLPAVMLLVSYAWLLVRCMPWWHGLDSLSSDAARQRCAIACAAPQATQGKSAFARPLGARHVATAHGSMLLLCVCLPA